MDTAVGVGTGPKQPHVCVSLTSPSTAQKPSAALLVGCELLSAAEQLSLRFNKEWGKWWGSDCHLCLEHNAETTMGIFLSSCFCLSIGDAGMLRAGLAMEHNILFVYL